MLNGSSRRVPASFLRRGNEIVISPFAMILCDCYVLDGFSSINESIVTGEYPLIEKNPGASVFAGTRNLGGIIVNSQLDSIILALEIAKIGQRHICFNLTWVSVYNVIALSPATGAITPFGIALTP